MGKKAAFISSLVLGLAQVLILIGLFLPFHKLSFFTVLLVRVARMSTYLLSVNIPGDSSDFCWIFDKLDIDSSKTRWCRRWDGSHDLQETTHRMCAPVLQHIWPSLCDGLSSAYVVGWAMVIIAVVNLILQVSAIYLLYDYSFRKANPQLRLFALSFSFIGTFLLLVVLAIYYVFVIIELDNIYGSGAAMLISLVMSVSKGFGMAGGYIMVSCGTLVQLASLVIFVFTQNEEGEERYEEYHFNKELNHAFRGDEQAYGSCPEYPVVMAPVQAGPPTMVFAQGPTMVQVPPAQVGFGIGSPGGMLGMAPPPMMAPQAPHLTAAPPSGPFPPVEISRMQGTSQGPGASGPAF